MNKYLLTALLTLTPVTLQAQYYAPVEFDVPVELIDNPLPHIVDLAVWRTEIYPVLGWVLETGLSKQHKVMPDGNACIDDMAVKAANAQKEFIKGYKEYDKAYGRVATYKITVRCVPVESKL